MLTLKVLMLTFTQLFNTLQAKMSLCNSLAVCIQVKKMLTANECASMVGHNRSHKGWSASNYDLNFRPIHALF